MTDHAWVLLPSGCQLDLLALHPCAWADRGRASTMSDNRAGMDMARQTDPEAVPRVAYEDP